MSKKNVLDQKKKQIKFHQIRDFEIEVLNSKDL